MTTDLRSRIAQRASLLQQGQGEQQPVEQSQQQEQPSNDLRSRIEERANLIPKDERSTARKVVDKGTRLVSQRIIGGIQGAAFPLDMATTISQKIGEGANSQLFRQEIGKEIEGLLDKKAFGKFDEKDQERLEYFSDLIRNPEKTEQFLPKDVVGFDTGSLIEAGAKKLTGIDLAPRDASEMAARWIGFVHNPKTLSILKNGFNPSNIKTAAKALIPSAKQSIKTVGAVGGLTLAADLELGPIGTMLMAVFGDSLPDIVQGGAKGIFKTGKNLFSIVKEGGFKKVLAKGAAAFTPRDKEALQKSIINDFRKAGVQGDLGSISGNNIVKWIQSTLGQSGLTGAPLEEFKKSLTKNIVSEYKKLAGTLGESIHQSRFEAGAAIKEHVTNARDLDLAKSRELFTSLRKRGGKNTVFGDGIANVIKEVEKDLIPGSFKSAEQQKVLDILNVVKKDVISDQQKVLDVLKQKKTKNGLASVSKKRKVPINGLINTKIALGDAINYEVQGGAKKLLGRIVKEVDKAIASHDKVDSAFARDWVKAKSGFAKHAKLFRGKSISTILKTQDPSQIFNQMNTPHGISQVKQALSKLPGGTKLFNELAAFKLEEMIGKNLVDSTSQQLNFGTFSKLLQKGQNREIARQLLGTPTLKRLEVLQNASGRIADTAQKFLNASRSGVHAADLVLVGKIMGDVSKVFDGNPWSFKKKAWSLVKSGGSFLGGKQLSKLIADPKFIRLVEDAILEGRGASGAKLQSIGLKLAERIKQIQASAKESVKPAISQASR